MKIRIGFLTALGFSVLFFSRPAESLAILLMVGIHEATHIASAKALGVGFSELRLSPLGAALIPDAALPSHFAELLIAASAPLINLAIAGLLGISPFCVIPFLSLCRSASFFLAILNLLPMRGFDGGRIVFSLFCLLGLPAYAKGILTFFTVLILFFLWSFSAYLLLRVGASLSVFLFSCSLFQKFFVNDTASSA